MIKFNMINKNTHYAFKDDHSHWICKDENNDTFIYSKWRIFPEPSQHPIFQASHDSLEEAIKNARP